MKSTLIGYSMEEQIPLNGLTRSGSHGCCSFQGYGHPGRQGWNQIMAEVGEGNLNWKGITEACARTGVKWAAVEQDVCRPLESLAISRRTDKNGIAVNL